MKVRAYAWILPPVAAALVLLVGLASCLGVLRTGRPNVLLITLDTTRADRLGCYGYSGALTPALDALAQRGVLFENAVCAVPLTLPSHATILTGLHPPEHGLRLNSAGTLPPDVPTLASVLRQGGYQTAAFIASPVLAARYGLNRGFQTYDDSLPLAAQRGGDDAHPPYRSGAAVAATAVQWLEKTRTPFFCWVHFYDPHWPYYPHEDLFESRFRDRPYDAEIAFADLQVRRVLDALAKKGITRRTLVVVAGDHGETLGGPHGEPRPHHGLMLYRDTMHVPLILSWPEGVAEGLRVKPLVSLADVYPTVLAFAGIRKFRQGSGQDLRPAMRGRPPAPRACYGESDLPASYGWSPQRSLTTEEWKYIRTPLPELYDLRRDPGETCNLATALVQKAEDLGGELSAVEDRMAKRSATSVVLSAGEKRQIESLGYVGGGAAADAAGTQRKDIKDMLPVLRRSTEAENLAKRGDQAGAVAIWREVVARSPETWNWRNSLSTSLLDAGERGEAIRVLIALKEAMENKRGAHAVRTADGMSLYPSVLNNLAFALSSDGRPEEALPFAKAALSLDEARGAFHHTLATIWQGLGDLESAEQSARRAVEMAAIPEHLLCLGEIRLARGDRGEALRLTLQVLSSRPASKDQRLASSLLQRIRAVDEAEKKP